jgi:hypothetical protein
MQRRRCQANTPTSIASVAINGIVCRSHRQLCGVAGGRTLMIVGDTTNLNSRESSYGPVSGLLARLFELIVRLFGLTPAGLPGR